jgi:hypothetical protein
MQRSKGNCFAKAKGNGIVLFARLVDGAGRPIGPSDVARIEYSIRESWTRLKVCDVILPELVVDKLWSVDSVGYNFRHDIADFASVASGEFSGRVEIRYVLVLANHTPLFIRFHLKLT